MATYSLSPLFNGWQGFNAAGEPLNLGTIEVYLAGTNTPTPTYTTSTGLVQNSNPIVLNNGFPPNQIWLQDGVAVKFVVKDAAGSTISTNDNVTGRPLNGGSPNVATMQTSTATAGQSLFTLNTAFAPGIAASVIVNVDGLQYVYGTDFSHVGVTQIQFVVAFVGGEEISFLIMPPLVGGVSLSNVTKGFTEDASGTSTDIGSYRFRRRANYSSGTAGFVNAALYVDSFVKEPSGGALGGPYEWAGVFVMNNYASDGENVGCYRQGIKYSGAGPTWAGVDEIIDHQTDPTSGAVGCELSYTANGTDANTARVAYDIALRKRDPAGVAPTLSWGFRIQTETGSKVARGFGFNASATADVGFDTSLALMNIAAIKMATNQAIIFAADNSRKMFHSGSAFEFTNAAGTEFWGLNDDYSLSANGVQLLGTRRPGWGPPTGTATRTTFATGTVTTTQLAERVKALIDDLTTHGLIGP